jgi:hypothetical protein
LLPFDCQEGMEAPQAPFSSRREVRFEAGFPTPSLEPEAGRPETPALPASYRRGVSVTRDANVNAARFGRVEAP